MLSSASVIDSDGLLNIALHAVALKGFNFV